MILYIIGLITGYVLGYAVNNADNNEPKQKNPQNIRDAVDICEKMANTEVYISLDEEIALKNVVAYMRKELEKEDDLK